jgi:hypothetical protein
MEHFNREALPHIGSHFSAMILSRHDLSRGALRLRRTATKAE